MENQFKEFIEENAKYGTLREMFINYRFDHSNLSELTSECAKQIKEGIDKYLEQSKGEIRKC